MFSFYIEQNHKCPIIPEKKLPNMEYATLLNTLSCHKYPVAVDIKRIVNGGAFSLDLFEGAEI